LRQSSKDPSQRPYDIVFEPQDFDPHFDRATHASTNLQKLFEDVVGCEDVIAKLSGYQQITQGMKSKGLEYVLSGIVMLLAYGSDQFTQGLAKPQLLGNWARSSMIWDISPTSKLSSALLLIS